VIGVRWSALSAASIAEVVSAANPGRFPAAAGHVFALTGWHLPAVLGDPARTAAFAAATGIEPAFAGYASMRASVAGLAGRPHSSVVGGSCLVSS
jgi:hypothetical protein